LIFRLDIHSQEYCNNVKYANMYKHVCGHMYMWLYVLSNSRKAKYVGMYICSLRVTMLLQIESKVLYISTYVCKWYILRYFVTTSETFYLTEWPQKIFVCTHVGKRSQSVSSGASLVLELFAQSCDQGYSTEANSLR
jgi:hypothetical protein